MVQVADAPCFAARLHIVFIFFPPRIFAVWSAAYLRPLGFSSLPPSCVLAMLSGVLLPTRTPWAGTGACIHVYTFCGEHRRRCNAMQCNAMQCNPSIHPSIHPQRGVLNEPAIATTAAATTTMSQPPPRAHHHHHHASCATHDASVSWRRAVELNDPFNLTSMPCRSPLPPVQSPL